MEMKDTENRENMAREYEMNLFRCPATHRLLFGVIVWPFYLMRTLTPGADPADFKGSQYVYRHCQGRGEDGAGL